MNGLSGVCLMQDVVWFMSGLFIDGVLSCFGSDYVLWT